MSFILNKPPSLIANETKMAAKENDDGPKKKNKRECYKMQKELEIARRAGKVPAMKDESGK